MKQYLDLMRHARERVVRKGDGTGTGILSVFDSQMWFDLGEGFPVAATKSTHMRSVIHELLWFLRGGTFTWIANRFGRFGPELTA